MRVDRAGVTGRVVDRSPLDRDDAAIELAGPRTVARGRRPVVGPEAVAARQESDRRDHGKKESPHGCTHEMPE
jgi:hypothetical protein